jgi:hypothetical protein
MRISCNTWLRAMTSSTEGSERVVCWSIGTLFYLWVSVPFLPFTCLTRFVVWCVRACARAHVLCDVAVRPECHAQPRSF